MPSARRTKPTMGSARGSISPTRTLHISEPWGIFLMIFHRSGTMGMFTSSLGWGGGKHEWTGEEKLRAGEEVMS